MLECSHPQAQKIARHLERKEAAAAGAGGGGGDGGPYAPATAATAPVSKFVWAKKIEKDLEHGGTVKDYTARAERQREIERCVLLRR